jgi:hypothetical protein
MIGGRSRKKKLSSSNFTDENDHSQTGQGEKIATPPAHCTSVRKGRLEELTEMNPSNPLQTQPEIGNNYYNAASTVSPNDHHQDKKSSLFTIERIAKPLPNAAQTLKDQHFEEPESQQLYLDCLTQVWHREMGLFLGNWKSTAMKLMYPLSWQQFNILRKFMIQMNFPLTLKAKMTIVFPSFLEPYKDPYHLKRFP